MDQYSVTIDTGTTNSRIFVWRCEELVAEASRPVGVRDTAITGSTQALVSAVRDAITEALGKAGIASTEGVRFLSSGMITSNVGLCEIPHLIAPVGIDDLAAGIRSVVLKDVVDQPIHFIPGIRNNDSAVTVDNCEAMDMMRGEETETIGAIRALDVEGPAVIILPGSHSKFVKINEKNRITGCVTTISGELLDVITKNTILASSLDHGFASSIEEEALLKGARYCASVGLSRCCFSVRILDIFRGLTLSERQNFLLGAVLQTDLLALKESDALKVDADTKMVVCGKPMLRDALALLLKHDGFFRGAIKTAPDSLPSLSGLGTLAVAEVAGLLA